MKKKFDWNHPVIVAARAGNCVVCLKTPCDPAHVSARGWGNCKTPMGMDINDERNVMSLCHEHHSLQGTKGWVYMFKTYYAVKKWLEENGRTDILEKEFR